MKLTPFNTRIGLALGGGRAKGIAHIGVLKAFEEERIPIHCISGTSAGNHQGPHDPIRFSVTR